jgi:hypothetical protein
MPRSRCLLTPVLRRGQAAQIAALQLPLVKQLMLQPSSLVNSVQTAEKKRPAFRLPVWPCWLLTGLLLLTCGCFQQRYEPANWESAPRKAAAQPKATRLSPANTSLPGSNKPVAERPGGTTLPTQAKANGTLPGRGVPPKRASDNRPANGTLPLRGDSQPTTLPGRKQARPNGSTTLPGRLPRRESGSTLPSRQSRPTAQPSRGNSNQTLPGRK